MGGELIPVNPDSLPDEGGKDTGAGACLTSKESNTLKRAFRERWPISDDQRTAAVKAIVYTIVNTDDDRARAAAFKALVESDKLNVEAAGDRPNTGEITIRVVHGNTNPPAD